MISQMRNIGGVLNKACKSALTQTLLRQNLSTIQAFRASQCINTRINQMTQSNIYSFASFKEKMEKKQKEKAEDEFKKEIEFLANKPSFTLVDFKQRVIDQLSKLKKGLKAKLLSGQQENEAALTKQKTLLNAFTDEELIDPSKIASIQKKQIAMIAQCEVEDVNKLIHAFKNLQQAHAFLRRTKEKGQPLPESSEELQWRFRQEKNVSYEYKKSIQSRQYGRSKVQYRKMQKWSRRLQL
ncbi:hypothetical protein ABPG74_015186 [Tetrahymena malaccensis]